MGTRGFDSTSLIVLKGKWSREGVLLARRTLGGSSSGEELPGSHRELSICRDRICSESDGSDSASSEIESTGSDSNGDFDRMREINHPIHDRGRRERI
ncbi:MAG: hypothetical protein DSY81_10035 [Bacillota bacterium]|nr:MAG: hypothetical protein DSY92_02610 [Planctomycetota bacterium]RUA08194.1 MAG: hypothetical protein DSY81_10035 [Bacillota bacterium]